jgi:hypothetical protein
MCRFRRLRTRSFRTPFPRAGQWPVLRWPPVPPLGLAGRLAPGWPRRGRRRAVAVVLAGLVLAGLVLAGLAPTGTGPTGTGPTGAGRAGRHRRVRRRAGQDGTPGLARRPGLVPAPSPVRAPSPARAHRTWPTRATARRRRRFRPPCPGAAWTGRSAGPRCNTAPRARTRAARPSKGPRRLATPTTPRSAVMLPVLAALAASSSSATAIPATADPGRGGSRGLNALTRRRRR